jgi:hypothetical protein
MESNLVFINGHRLIATREKVTSIVQRWWKFFSVFLKFTVRPAVFVYAPAHDEQAIVD